MASAQAFVPNPFTPAFGKVPAFMAGREQITEDMVQAFAGEGGDPNLCSIFVGARGTGKTALLTYLGQQAAQQGWVVANVSAQEGMLDDVLQRVREAAAHLVDDAPKRRLTGIGIASLGSASWENEPASGANWRTRMNGLFDQLAEADAGIVITVDEVDPALPEMTELCTTFQHFVRENRKAALLMAGLPHKVSALLSGRSTSFLRRAFRHDLGPIASYDVEEAFRLTVESGAKRIDDDALAEAVRQIDGFPYMFQLVGYRAWNAARLSPAICEEHVRRGARLAREVLAASVYDATISELSKNDLAFVRAMNPGAGEKTTRDELKTRLGKSSSHVSTYRKRLLDAGVIEEGLDGTFSFALPGFGEYVNQRFR